MPKLSEIQQEQRRTRILDAAENCFARNGFHRTTMQDICREAGISAGALYLYFGSKEALIEGISSRSRQDVLAAFALLDRAEDFAAGLGQVLQACILAKPRHKSVLWLEISAEATRNPSIAAIHRACELQIRNELLGVLSRAASEGRIRPVMPLEEIVATMMVIGDGLFWQHAVTDDFDAGRAAEGVLPLVVKLVGPVANEPAIQRPRQLSDRESV